MALPAAIVRLRACAGAADLDAVRALLARVAARRAGWNAWSVVRFDHWSHHRLADADLLGDTSWHERVALWEADGALVAAALLDAECPGDGVVIGDPTAAVEHEQLAWLEDGRDAAADGEELLVEASDRNPRLTHALSERGYAPIEGHWVARERRLDPDERDAVVVAPPYRVKHVETEAELWALHVAVESVFGRAGPDTIPSYRYLERAPSHVPELCLVAIDDAGRVGAFASAWIDPNGVAELEPVGTAPAHRRHGLAAAVVAEACNRLRALGCPLVTVGSWSGSAPANAFYDAAGLVPVGVAVNWRRG